MVSVHFSAGLRDLTGDVTRIELDAKSVRLLFRQLDEMYPGMRERLMTATAVAINGEIIADAIYEDLPEGAEVHFLEALAGG